MLKAIFGNFTSSGHQYSTVFFSSKIHPLKKNEPKWGQKQSKLTETNHCQVSVIGI